MSEKKFEKSEAIPEKAFIEYSEHLEKYLEENKIKIFDYSKYNNLKYIGKGGFAVVYSATFEGKEYALKSINNNLGLSDKEFKLFKRE
ncbi:10729_t:CDS:2, partial [Scutellospora calospora]